MAVSPGERSILEVVHTVTYPTVIPNYKNRRQNMASSIFLYTTLNFPNHKHLRSIYTHFDNNTSYAAPQHAHAYNYPSTSLNNARHNHFTPRIKLQPQTRPLHTHF